MKIFEKKWVKAGLVFAFLAFFTAAVVLDSVTIWSREMGITQKGEKNLTETEKEYKDSMAFKKTIFSRNSNLVQQLCEGAVCLQSHQQKNLTITEYDITGQETAESRSIPLESRTITWKEYLVEQGISNENLYAGEDWLEEGAAVYGGDMVSNYENFIRLSVEDFLMIFEICPSVSLENFDEDEIENILLSCYGFADGENKDQYWRSRDKIRLYQSGKDYILYNKEEGYLARTGIGEIKISRLEGSSYVYIPQEKAGGEYTIEQWLKYIAGGFTTDLVQQLSYEQYMTYGVNLWNEDYNAWLQAAEIYQNDQIFVTYGEKQEEDVCISLETKEEKADIFHKGNIIYQDEYKVRLYYDEGVYESGEHIFAEYLYSISRKLGSQDTETTAVVVSVVAFGLAILLLVTAMWSIWNRKKEKFRDRVPFEVMLLGTGLILTVICSGIYVLLVELLEIFLFILDINLVINGYVIVLETLGVVALGLCYVLISTIVFRFKTHSFLKRCFLGRSILWIIVKTKKIGQNMEVLKRRILFLAVLWILSFIAMTIIYVCAGEWYGFVEIFCYLIFMGSFSFVTIKDALDNKRLLEGCIRMKDGRVGEKISTEKLYFDKLALAQAINTMGEGLEKAVKISMQDERMKTELITNVSHDIKTPLTSIINYVDLLKKEGVTKEEQQEYLKVLESKAQRLKQLIEDLVEVSKTSTGNVDFQMTNLDFQELLNQALGEFQEKFEEQNLEMVVCHADHKVQIWADGRRCYRILENLLENAYKYAMPGTRVYIDVEQDHKQLIFIMKNISKAPLNIPVEELMERFVRGDVSRSTSGNGLGLSIAQNLVQLQNGTFQISLDGDLFKVEIQFPVLETDCN